jgi:fucose permease
MRSATPRRIDERRVLRRGAFVATAAIAAWLVTPGAGILVLVLVIGLGLAPLFPTAVAVFESRLGSAGMAASGPVFALSGIGGAVVPWLVGLVSVRFGGLEAGLLVVLATSVGVLALTLRAFGPAK